MGALPNYNLTMIVLTHVLTVHKLRRQFLCIRWFPQQIMLSHSHYHHNHSFLGRSRFIEAACILREPAVSTTSRFQEDTAGFIF